MESARTDRNDGVEFAVVYEYSNSAQMLSSRYNCIYLRQHLLRLFVIRPAEKVLLSKEIRHPLDQHLQCLFRLEEEVCVDHRCVAGLVRLLDLLLDDHELYLDQVEQGLDRLLCLLALLGILVVAAVRDDADEIVNHDLVLDGLTVVADLEEVVGDLLVDVDLLFQVRADLQDFCLVVNCFLEVLETLQIGDHQLQGLDLHVDIDVARCEYLQYVGELLVRFDELSRELVSLREEHEGLLDIAISYASVIDLQLDLQCKLRGLYTLLKVLEDHVVLSQLLVRFHEAQESVWQILLDFYGLQHGL